MTRAALLPTCSCSQTVAGAGPCPQDTSHPVHQTQVHTKHTNAPRCSFLHPGSGLSDLPNRSPDGFRRLDVVAAVHVIRPVPNHLSGRFGHDVAHATLIENRVTDNMRGVVIPWSTSADLRENIITDNSICGLCWDSWPGTTTLNLFENLIANNALNTVFIQPPYECNRDLDCVEGAVCTPGYCSCP